MTYMAVIPTALSFNNPEQSVQRIIIVVSYWFYSAFKKISGIHRLSEFF